MDKGKWNELIRDRNYKNENKPKNEIYTLKKPVEIFEYSIEENAYDNDIAGKYGKVGAFVVLIILMSGILFLIIREQYFIGNNKISKDTGEIDLSHIEENLDSVNLDIYIQQAAENENFRLAIRLIFLNILKWLSAEGKITFKKDKTNRAYLTEMYGHNRYKDFLWLTLYFEKSWYGEANTGRKEYTEYTNLYNHFRKQGDS